MDHSNRSSYYKKWITVSEVVAIGNGGGREKGGGGEGWWGGGGGEREGKERKQKVVYHSENLGEIGKVSEGKGERGFIHHSKSG